MNSTMSGSSSSGRRTTVDPGLGVAQDARAPLEQCGVAARAPSAIQELA